MRALAIGGVRLSTDVPRIVAAGGEDEVDALVTATGADLLELRIDLFRDPRPEVVRAALARLRAGGRPIIATVRAAAEGGRPLDDARRQALYEAALADADAIDVEIASPLAPAVVPRAKAAGCTVILSAHTLDHTPTAEALLALVDRAATSGADVTKLATHAASLEDVRTLLDVTLRARTRGVVTLAMGPFGVTRVLLPAAGSLLTYGHVGRPTAPSGQLPLDELAALLRRLYGG
jgi:3-dehydroquinate dehydratase type I